MADGRPSLSVESRPERGSRAIRRLRREGFVPGVIYGTGEPVAFKVPALELRRILADHAALFDVAVGDERARPVILKDRQDHPVRGEVMHVDLLQVRLDERIHAAVPLELEGADDAPGVRDGGVLEHVTRELNVEALPTDIPEQILVDVSGLEAAGTLHLAQVPVPAGLTFLDDLDETIVATVTMPSQVDLPEEIEEETVLVGSEARESGAEGETGEEADTLAADPDAS